MFLRLGRSLDWNFHKLFIRLQIGAAICAVLTDETFGPADFGTSRRGYTRGSLFGKHPWLVRMPATDEQCHCIVYVFRCFL